MRRHRVSIFKVGTPTMFNNILARPVGNSRYRISDNSMSIWDRRGKVSVCSHKSNLVQIIKPLEVDPLFGEVLLDEDSEGTQIMLSGTYLPYSGVAHADRYVFEQTSKSTKTGILPYAELKIEEFSWIDGDIFSAEKPVFVEISNASGSEAMRGWFQINLQESRRKPDVELKLKPDWDCGISYGWNKSAWR